LKIFISIFYKSGAKLRKKYNIGKSITLFSPLNIGIASETHRAFSYIFQIFSETNSKKVIFSLHFARFFVTLQEFVGFP